METKSLVVCYSRGGTTRRLAKDIAERLGADFEAIEESTDRSGMKGYSRSLIEAVARGVPSIRMKRSPRQYDLVVLGAPVWAGTMASPLRTYLLLQRQELRSRVAFFTTMAGRGAHGALREMKVLCGWDDTPTCIATTQEVRTGKHRTKVEAFIEKLTQEAAYKPTEAQA